MAKKIETYLIDDIDGTPADGTVQFGIDGELYSIDLSSKHSLELYKSIEKFRDNGTRLGRIHLKSRTSDTSVKRVPVGVNRDRNAAIRAWAEQQGITVSTRGRIQEAVVAKYDAAHAA
ncbi:Lsr2 family protein [Glycomyces sp. YM15]|uniref:histone-like nucleoid-structuring protein Lsr2 n=1 Tax=Glycomyces sp. YM15 TaxID=2800446 RepID=UPI0019631312|nr:Lsr2 family protein [Glycomyces sp. YM15]